jgi:sec-independent protein translocase protein TatC
MKVPQWLRRLRGTSGQAEMSFLDHLDELRSVLLSCLVALLVLAVGAWIATEPVMNYLVQHVARLERAVFLKPTEPFTTRVKIALLMAFIAGLPYIGFQIWSFVVPGLMQREKRIVFPLVFWSSILFIVGVGFATFALSPTMLIILRSFGTEFVQESLSIGYLLDFLVKMAFACGIMFQLPLVVAVLSLFGLVTPGFLKSKWRHAIVLILFIAAVVTPGDGPSQLVLALPVILLYFVSIWISAVICRGQREPAGEPAGDPAGDPAGEPAGAPAGAAPPASVEDDSRPAGAEGRRQQENPDRQETTARETPSTPVQEHPRVSIEEMPAPPKDPRPPGSIRPPKPEPKEFPDDWSI